MRQEKTVSLSSIAILATLTLSLSLVPTVQGFRIEATDRVTHVVDGDTFDTVVTGRIRLADVNAPERYSPGGHEATAALTSMIDGKTVYLDIDDKTGTDRYGREVCVVYVTYNSTHILNVNKALLDQGHAVIDDFTNNEFNPYTWTTFAKYPESQSTPPPTASPPSPPSTVASPLPSSAGSQFIVGLATAVLVLALIIMLGLALILSRRFRSSGKVTSSKIGCLAR